LPYDGAMRTLIITGGTGGLGTDVVERLRREYHCVLLVRSEGPEGVDAIHADLASETSVRAAFAHAVETWGAPYGVVHLAGGFAAGRIVETDGAAWSKMLALNTTGAFFVIREALAVMQGPGRIIAISSVAALRKGGGTAAYTVSKSALNALIEVAAAEARGAGITVNGIAPGTLATPAVMKDAAPDARLVPLDRVAETIVFLLSEAGASITGTIIPLEG
jgi:NAD(P)-dependent dehydrogenase (short-subunit alcohol dehydrogenase family)